MPNNTMLTPPVTGALILERLPQVLRRTGLSRSEWYRRIADGSAPAQIKLGKHASAWDSRAVDRWISERIGDTRDAKVAA